MYDRMANKIYFECKPISFLLAVYHLDINKTAGVTFLTLPWLYVRGRGCLYRVGLCGKHTVSVDVLNNFDIITTSYMYPLNS